MSRRGGVVFGNHMQEGDEAEGRVVENRRGQGRESSEGQSESEDGGQQLGSRDRDLSRSRGYVAGSGSRSRATGAAKGPARTPARSGSAVAVK